MAKWLKMVPFAIFLVEVLCLILLQGQLGSTVTCPPPCRCNLTEDFIWVNCSWRRLTVLPLTMPTNVTHLDFSENKLLITNETFLDFPLLRYLDLDSNGIPNHHLRSGTFKSLVFLEVLIVSNCDFLSISPFAFDGLHHLKYLSVANNRQLGMDAVMKAIKEYGKRLKTPLDVLDVGCINKYHLDEHNVLDHTFVRDYLQPLGLRGLDMRQNSITEVHFGALLYIPNIEALVLKGNFISKHPYFLLQIMLLRRLRILDLSEQNWNSQEPLDASEYNSLKSFLSLSLQTQPYRTNANVTYSNYTFKSRYDILPNNTSGQPILDIELPPFPLPPFLEFISIRRNPGNYFNILDDNDIMVDERNSLNYIDASEFVIREIGTPVRGLIHLNFVNMQSCRTETINAEFYSHFPSLETLLIGNNKIANVLHKNTDGRLFMNNTNLKSLDLAANNISFIPNNTFKALENIRYINLSDNTLTDLARGLLHNITSLGHLNLRGNRFTDIRKHTRSEMDSIAENGGLEVDLGENPLVCTCKTLEFLEWMHATRVMFISGEMYRCRYLDGDDVRLVDLDLPTLKRRCGPISAPVLEVVIPVAGSVLVVSVVLALVAYRYRWRLRYFIFISSRFWRRYEEENELQAYVYDAFVAFNGRDVEWVVSKLRPMMENTFGYRLCIHDRDFLPGAIIEETIVEVIETSRKTILVLSRNFLGSNWCHFEMQMARSRLFRDGRDCLILVLLEDLASEEVSKSRTLRNLLDTKTYIKWPKNEADQEIFWKQLSLSMKKANLKTLAE